MPQLKSPDCNPLMHYKRRADCQETQWPSDNGILLESLVNGGCAGDARQLRGHAFPQEHVPAESEKAV